MGQKTVYQCDACKDSVDIDGRSSPSGWRRVVVKLMDQRYTIKLDICEKCFSADGNYEDKIRSLFEMLSYKKRVGA